MFFHSLHKGAQKIMTNKKYFLLSLVFLGLLSIAPLAMARMEVRGEDNGRFLQMMSRPEVLGTVTAVSGNTITVKDLRANTGTIYTVDATNATIIKNGTTSSVSNILVNDTISVQGVLNGTIITATKINDGLVPKENEMGKPRVVATVTAVSGNTITATDNRKMKTTVTYTINATGATIMKNGNTATVSSIVVGDKISVQGTLSGTTITATKINVGGKNELENNLENENNLNNPMIVGNGQPIVAGKVTAISGNTITITNKSNTTYAIDATNAKVQSQGTISMVSNIAINDNVIVQGTINGTNVSASLIIDQKTNTNNNQINNQNSNSENQNKPAPKRGGILNWLKSLFGF